MERKFLNPVLAAGALFLDITLKRKDIPMRIPRPILLALVSASSLLLQPVVASSTWAADKVTVTQQISFTQMSGGDPPGWDQAANPTTWWCIDLHNVTIQGSGTKTIVTSDRIMADGSTHREIHTTVTGTAQDNVGGNYLFDYHQVASVDIPPSGTPVQVRLSDGYNLVGNSGVNNLHTHFTANFTAASPVPETWVYTPEHVHGTPFNCDPI